MRSLAGLLVKLFLLSGIALGCGNLAAAAQSESEGVDLALVLAVDVSRSMDFQEQQLQRSGYVQAFRDPEIIKAIQSGALGSIAVTYVEWSGEFAQVVVIPWTRIDGPTTAGAFAQRLASEPINSLNMTSISGALGFSAKAFDSLGAEATRRAIDISGDGPNNDGPPAAQARDRVLAKGITINGLPVMVKIDNSSIPDLDQYYKNCVIGGPAAFVLAIRSRDEFATATRRKLILEISDLLPEGASPASVVRVAATQYDCSVGERRRPQGFFQ